MFEVTKEFSFEAAHRLAHLPPEHKCHHLHGHSYKVVIRCAGTCDPFKQWVVDYAEISAVMDPIVKELDHKNLNDIIGPKSTAEVLASWIYEKLACSPIAKWVSAVEVSETEKTNVIYRP